MVEHFLVPPGMSLTGVLVLVATSLFTSMISAAFGLGGGVALLAVMPVFMPPQVLIPVHGMVQIGSNFGRLLVMRQHVRWTVLLPFGLGSGLGAGLGGLLMVELPVWLLELGLGSFILYMLYGRVPAIGAGGMALGGAVSSFLTMFFGATGPFVAAWVKRLALDRLGHVGTFAACMSLQHGLKIAVFGLLGFAYGPYLGFIAAMVGSGFIGTLLGRRLLIRLGEHRFERGLRIILSLLALRLLWRGLSGPGG